MSKTPHLSPNGAGPQIPEQLLEQAMANYHVLATQLGACLTLLSALPLPLMLAANERLQSRTALTLPPGATAEQATVIVMQLRNDAKLIKAAVQLIRTLVAVQTGQPT